jgi:O-antigen/teichoic acid export membrane protein
VAREERFSYTLENVYESLSVGIVPHPTDRLRYELPEAPIMTALTEKIRSAFYGRSGTAATLQTLLSRLVVMALNLLTGMLIARLLGVDGRGEQAAIILWPQFFSCIMTLGIPSALIYHLKRYPDEQAKFFAAATIVSLGLGGLAALVGIWVIPLWMAHYSPIVIYATQGFMVLTPMLLLALTFTAALEACEQFGKANQARYLQGSLTFLMVLVLGALHHSTPLTLAAAYLLPTLPMLWLMGGQLRQEFGVFRLPSHDTYPRLLNYGLRAYGIELLGTLYLQIGGMLVVKILSASELGWYAVALSLSRMLSLLQSSVVTVLLPKTAARPPQEVLQLTGQATRISLLCLMVPSVGLGVAAPLVLTMLYGPEFAEAVPTLRVLLLEALLASATYVLTRAFMALGQPGVVAALQIAGLVVAVPATVLLMHWFGLLGASLALFASSCFRLIMTLICFPLILNVSPPSLVPQKADFQRLRRLYSARSAVTE